MKRENIALVVFDFDGVMTDNRAILDENGKESVFISRADGEGVVLLRKMGLPMTILSSEKNKVVARRAEKLSLPVMQGIAKKEDTLSEYCASNGIPLEKVLYVGNDVNDLEAMKLCGFVVVPNDAHQCVKDVADVILRTNGGYGVVRELADLL